MKRVGLTLPTSVCLTAMWLCGGPAAYGSTFPTPGIETQGAAGAGQTTSRNASALFYNPANLAYSGTLEPYFSISLLSAQYSYTHFDPKNDTVTVRVTAPPVLAGGVVGFGAFRLGLGFLPTGTGAEQNIEKVPLQLTSDEFQVVNVTNSDAGFQLAVGSSVSFSKSTSIGATWLLTSEKKSTYAATAAEGTPVIDAHYAGQFNQFIVGGQSQVADGRCTLAASYRTSLTGAYEGTVTSPLTDNKEAPIDAVKFSPAIIGTGIDYRFTRKFGLFFDYSRELSSAGRSAAKSGLGTDSPEVDLVDTNNFAGGAYYMYRPNLKLQGAMGLYPSNIGDGRIQYDANGAFVKKEVEGVRFGNLEAIPRFVMASSVNWDFTSTKRVKRRHKGKERSRTVTTKVGNLQAMVSYQAGRREVGEGAPGEGTYVIKVYSIGFGGGYDF